MNGAPTRLVLFVCVENIFRSVIAEAIFNAHAPSGWHAESAGVTPADSINPVAVELLEEIGIKVAHGKPRGVTPALIGEASHVITFGCIDRCPLGAREKCEDWPIPRSTGRDDLLRPREELLTIRGEVERRVLKLIHQLQRTGTE